MLVGHALLALCWDTNTTMRQVRVEKAKLSLIHHIQSIDESSLPKQIYREQLCHGWPGLVEEYGDLMKMEDDLNSLKMEDNLKFPENIKQMQFIKMEDEKYFW